MKNQSPCLSLPSWVSDHMILPTGITFELWGTAKPGSSVSIGFNHISAGAAADEQGRWEVCFPKLPAGMRGDLRIVSGLEKIRVGDVVSGDIFVCSGQSNILRPVSDTYDRQEAVGDVSRADVRIFTGKEWIKAEKNNVDDLPAVPFFFAAETGSRREIPIGVCIAAAGGTGIEAWVPQELFPDTELGRELSLLVDHPEVLKAAEEDRADMRKYGEHRLARWGLGRAVPSALFHEMVEPFGTLPVKGVLWYQGESNADTLLQAKEYDQWLFCLIRAYRNLWNNEDLPFLIIRLPEYDADCPEAWALVQEKQAKITEDTARVFLVDIHGLGDRDNIHPKRKRAVGCRTAQVAQKRIY